MSIFAFFLMQYLSKEKEEELSESPPPPGRASVSRAYLYSLHFSLLGQWARGGLPDFPTLQWRGDGRRIVLAGRPAEAVTDSADLLYGMDGLLLLRNDRLLQGQVGSFFGSRGDVATTTVL